MKFMIRGNIQYEEMHKTRGNYLIKGVPKKLGNSILRNAYDGISIKREGAGVVLAD